MWGAGQLAGDGGLLNWGFGGGGWGTVGGMVLVTVWLAAAGAVADASARGATDAGGSAGGGARGAHGSEVDAWRVRRMVW